MRGLLKDSTRFRQPSLAFSSLFRDLFGGLFGGLFGRPFLAPFWPASWPAFLAALGGRFRGLPGRLWRPFWPFWRPWRFAGRPGGLPGGRFGRLPSRLGGLRFHGADRGQDPVNLPRDVLDGHHAVDRQQLAPLRIIVNQRLGQRAVARQPLRSALPGCRRFALPRRARASRRRGVSTRCSSALSLTRSSITASSLMCFFFRSSSSASACGTVRGKPSRMKPFLHVRLIETVGDDPDHDLVRHQPAAGHDVLGLQADRRFGGDRRAQHLAGRELDDAVAAEPAAAPGSPCPRPAVPKGSIS